ncbi:aspartate aminotransferase family protein [Salinivibrio kushneri]|uniref:Aspartate aminotransferase family protein n=1 Tax=Salinivibrio kushneri TaxID=1908198 RepID=A0AB36JXE5_9GAMM|nr:aspartate aminotransferase family protein [Salinivibrio kushneri]OOE39030.1 aspartate aminotransferase family protein [Salinivibrio kushneri]QCP01471.1 aspartate aminotransferase family protein [Salinivibrio kushneri]
MSHVFHRHCHQALPTIASGQGVYLTDTQGKRYLDACGGAAVSCLGHNHPAVLEAIHRQLDSIPYAHTGFFTSESSEALAKILADLAPPLINRAYLVSGGSEAMETALKLARQYWVEVGQPQRQHFIARRQSYHGNTLGALSVGGNAWRRAPFAPLLMDTSLIAPCYAYRDQGPDECAYQYGQRVANELETMLLEKGPETVIGFIAEPVVGATAGALTAETGYFTRIREICDQYNILLILDEVMCGTGRTGRFFAFEHEHIVPDIVAIAKGLAAGYQPIGATLVADPVYNAIANGSGFFQHGHTFMAHPTACAAALATLTTLEQEGLVDAAEKQGKALKTALHHQFDSSPFVGDIRGRGLFLALELVADKASKQPFSSTLPLAKQIKQTALENGLMCYPMGGTIDGKQGHHILLAPPYIIKSPHIDEIADKLRITLDTCLPH